MENRNTILNELKAISPVVAEAGIAVPYQVPQGYFDNFAASVLQRIKAGEAGSAKEELETLSPLLSGLGKKMPFTTPDNFFEELSDNAVAGAKAIDFVNVELENLSPLMGSLKDKQVYEAPAGYFDQLPQQVLQKVKSQSAKVVSMHFTRRVVRIAAAAVVAGLIIAAGWLYMGNGSGGEELDLAGIEQISDDALESFIENHEVLPAENMLAVNAEINPDDLKEMLVDVSDEELEKYVNQFIAKDNLTN